MPTYDYECDACGHTLEIFQSMTEGHKKKCPECGKLKLRRLIDQLVLALHRALLELKVDHVCQLRFGGNSKPGQTECHYQGAKGDTTACHEQLLGFVGMGTPPLSVGKGLAATTCITLKTPANTKQMRGENAHSPHK